MCLSSTTASPSGRRVLRRRRTTAGRILRTKSRDDDGRLDHCASVVRFAEPTQVHHIPSCLALLEQQQQADGPEPLRTSSTITSPSNKKRKTRTQLRQELFYTASDLNAFRRQAQDDLVQWKKNHKNQDTTTDNTVLLRGLEVKACPRRQQRKHAIVQAVVDAQDPYNDDDDDHHQWNALAHILREHSAWARTKALAQAHRDYYEAHHPELLRHNSNDNALLLLEDQACPTELAVVSNSNNIWKDNGEKQSPLWSSPCSNKRPHCSTATSTFTASLWQRPSLMGRRVKCRMY